MVVDERKLGKLRTVVDSMISGYFLRDPLGKGSRNRKLVSEASKGVSPEPTP